MKSEKSIQILEKRERFRSVQRNGPRKRGHPNALVVVIRVAIADIEPYTKSGSEFSTESLFTGVGFANRNHNAFFFSFCPTPTVEFRSEFDVAADTLDGDSRVNDYTWSECVGASEKRFHKIKYFCLYYTPLYSTYPRLLAALVMKIVCSEVLSNLLISLFKFPLLGDFLREFQSKQKCSYVFEILLSIECHIVEHDLLPSFRLSRFSILCYVWSVRKSNDC